MMRFGIAADIVQKTRIGLKLLQLFVDLPDRPIKTNMKPKQILVRISSIFDKNWYGGLYRSKTT